jgi:hypothetical protein
MHDKASEAACTDRGRGRQEECIWYGICAIHQICALRGFTEVFDVWFWSDKSGGISWNPKQISGTLR